MIRKDLIKREIIQLGRALRKILSELIDSTNNDNQSIEIAQSALKSEVNLDVDELKNVPENILIHYLTNQEGFDNDNLNLLAELLFEISTKNKDRKLANVTSTILTYLEEAERVYSFERQSKINTLKNTIIQK